MEIKSRFATPLLDARFDNLERMCADVETWNLDFKPLSGLCDGVEVGRIAQSQVGPLEVGRARFRVSLHQAAVPPANRVTFVVMERDMHRLWWRGFDEDANSVLIAQGGRDFESFSGADFHVHTVSVAEDALFEAAAALELTPPKRNDWPEVVRLDPVSADELRSALRWLNSSAANASNTHAVRNKLAAVWCSNDQQRKTRPSSRKRDIAVRRCLAALAETNGTLLEAADLRTIGKVSERTLEYAFRERFGAGPAAIIKTHRLGKLRADLLEADPSTASVGSIAAGYGFWHLGHLAADYRRAFGELPGRTLQRVAGNNHVFARKMNLSQ